MVQQKNEISEANLSHQSKSTISREHDCESESRVKRHGLSLDYKLNLKCHEADDMQKIDSVASARTNSVNKGIESKTTRSNRLNYGEGDSQHGTESSCSNSLLSNHSRQETSKEAYSFRNSGLTVDSSNSESVERRSEEPALVSSSDVLAHVVDNAVRNAMKVSSLEGSHSSLHINKENEDNSQEWGDVMLIAENVLGGVLEQTDTIGKREVCYDDDSNSLNLRTKAREDTKSRNEPDNSLAFHSEERISDPQSTKGCDKILAVQGKTPEVGTVAVDCDLTGNGFSGPSMTQPDKAFVKDQDTYIAGFDLNEDLNANEMDDYVRPDETLTSPEVIRVVAKAGIPRGSQMSPLKFEGRMGWMGSAKNSAFRNVVPSKTVDQNTCSSTVKSPEMMFSGIDLNVAVVEDIAPETQYVSSPSTLQVPADDDARRTKRLKIDLNHSLCDTEDDDPVQPSVPPKPDDSLLVDLNANASTKDKSNNVPPLSEVRRQFYGNQTDPRKQELSYASNNYWDGLRTTQQQLNAHGQQYLVAAAAPYVLQPVESMQRASHLQPMLPFAPNTLSPHNYISTVPFHFGSSHMRPSGTIPYARFPQEQGFSPQMLFPGNVQHSLITPPHLFNVVHDRSSGNLAPSSLKADVKSDENITANGSKKIEAGPSLFLGENYYSIADQEAWYGTSVKRKEPEGGSGYQQLGHRQAR